ncbi:MAG: hypothetical protein AB1469_00375 [Pseudomonadota bacterium]
MKIAISIPDDVFRHAERLAKRLGIARSKLYTAAMSNYLQAHSHEGVTIQLNRIYGEEPSLSNLDNVAEGLQFKSLMRRKDADEAW